MTIYQFIELTKKEPLKWINYCEIIIKRNGTIELAIPSHQEKLLEIYCKNMEIDREKFKKIFPSELDPVSFIIQKYDVICVWYNSLMVPEGKLNRFQSKTINILMNEGLIKIGNTIKCNEYEWYLKHKNLLKINYDL